MSRKMSYIEWQGFFKEILAGFFGGLIVLCWFLAYQALEGQSILFRIFIPIIIVIVLFIILISLLKSVVLDRKYKQF